jgi:hypothetical protein
MTIEDINIEFYDLASKYDREAKNYLRKHGKKGNDVFLIEASLKKNAISVAIRLIDKNAHSHTNGFLALLELSRAVNTEKERLRIKELTLESQYIKAYEMYANDFPDAFSEKTYKNAKNLMKW